MASKRTDCATIVVAAPKGGVGKTTIVMALLVSARLEGIDAVGINTDEQKSLTTWGEIRERSRQRVPEFVEAPVLTRPLDDYRKVFKEVSSRQLAIFDTPPGHSMFRHSVAALCGFADIIVIPTGTSALDLNEVVPFSSEQVGGKGVFVLNAVNRRTASFRTAQQRLLKTGRLCPVEIPRLEGIHSYVEKGLTALDLPNVKGAEDFASIWHFIRREVEL